MTRAVASRGAGLPPDEADPPGRTIGFSQIDRGTGLANSIPLHNRGDCRSVTMRNSFRGAVMALAGCLSLALVTPANAQYFGQNKVQRQKFQFTTLNTDHFQIYYYPEEAGAAQEVGRLAERWYSRLSRIFDHQ